MTSEDLAKIVGVLITLALAYLPFVKTWYEKQSPITKAAVAAGLTILAAAAIYGIKCGDLYPIPGVTCSKVGLQSLFAITVNALIALAGGYVTLVRPFKKQSEVL